MSSYPLYADDLPEHFISGPCVAIDTEAMGLCVGRDRLCLVQISTGPGHCCFVQPSGTLKPAPRLCALLTDPKVEKIFHFARFDVALLQHTYGLSIQNIYCTKIASKLVRTYTERHGLKELCKELLSIDLSKEQQSSDWGQPTLTPEQLAYGARDVLYLHALKAKLDELLIREGRFEIAQLCFQALSTVARLDALGFDGSKLFEH